MNAERRPEGTGAAQESADGLITNKATGGSQNSHPGASRSLERFKRAQTEAQAAREAARERARAEGRVIRRAEVNEALLWVDDAALPEATEAGGDL